MSPDKAPSLSVNTPACAPITPRKRNRLPILRRIAATLGIFTAAAVATVTPASAQTYTAHVIPGTTAVGSDSAVQTINIKPTTSGQVTEIRYLANGSQGFDFKDGGQTSATCQSLGASAGVACTVNVIFHPTAPGVRTGAIALLNGSQVLGVRLITANATGPLAVIRPGGMENVAGNGTFPYLQGADGIKAVSSSLFLPSGVVTDAAGDVFIADSSNNRIRRIDGSTGIITTFAGTGSAGNSPDNQAATTVPVNSPTGLAMDGAGNLYIADAGNNAVRKIDAFTGIMSTVVGQLNGSGYTGDTHLASQATLSDPNGVALDAQGNLYIADTGNNAIRKVDAVTGIITTVAGGTATGGDGGPAVNASLNSPWSLTFGPTGIMYIADRGNSTIRAVDTAGNISTIAGQQGFRGNGGNGGAATSAGLNGPTAVAVDPAGNVYIADSGNNSIRRVDATTQFISQFSGSAGSTAYYGDGLNADVATYYGPYALYLDGTGNLFIADLLHNRVRRIDAVKAVLNYPVMRVSKTSDPQTENIENDGNAPLTLQDPVFDQSALAAAPNTTCSVSNPLATNTTCALGIEFAPTVVSPDAGVTNGSLTYPSTASNSPIVVGLSGQVLSVNPTTTTLTSSLNPAGLGQAVTFTATVASDATTLTGTVAFYDGSTLLQTVTLASKSASMTTSALTLGSHTITAKYSGDEQDAAGTSNTVTQSILQTTSITLASSLNPSTVTQSVTFTATIVANTPTTPVASGTITFYDGSASLGTGTISGGVATFTTSTLSIASHNITASYVTSSNYMGSTSAVLTQVVNSAATMTSLSVNPNPAYVGTDVVLTATVSNTDPAFTGPAPTGNVTFKFGTTVLGPIALSSSQASVTVSSLPPGANSVIATYAGDVDHAGSTTTTTANINRLPTVTTVSSNANPANAGSPLQITATVTVGPGQTADGAINGTAIFYDGGTQIGSTVAVTNGNATLTTSALTSAASPHTLTATFTPATVSNYLGSTSANYSQVVQKTASTTTLTPSASTITAGKTLALKATVTTTTSVTATGNVSFYDGANLLGTSPLTAGNVTLNVSTLAVGPHNITAVYAGDANFISSTSAVSTVNVTIGETSLTLTSTPSPAVIQATNTVTFNATLTTNGVLPSPATITLQDNGASLSAPLTLNASGSVSFSTSTLSVGTHNIVAIYGGDPNNNSATSSVITVTVNAATTTTTINTNVHPSAVGDAVTIQAAISSAASNITGTVTFYDGVNIIGSSTVASGNASLTLSTFTVGSHTLKAVYSGDSVHASSTSVVFTQQVVQPTNVSLRSDNNPAISGTPVNLISQVVATSAATSPSALPTGTVTYKEGNTIVGTATLSGGVATLNISSLTVGTHNIIANYGGDSLYQASSSAVLVQTIRNAATSTVLAVSANPSAYGSTETLTAHVTGNGGTVTGTVAFLDGTTTIGTGTVASNGTAVFTTSALSPGMHVITASYAGDAANSPSVSTAVNLQVQQNSQTSLSVNTNPALTLSTVILTATINNTAAPIATGTVSFRDGSVALGTATVNAAGVATLQVGPFTAGTHNITAAYSGDVGDLPSTSAALPLVVNLRPTQTALSATAPSPDGFLSLIAAIHWDGPAVPTGVVTFSTSTGVIGTSNVNSVGVATLNITSSAINGTVTATYGGDASYSGSASPATTIQLAAATNFTIGLNPTSMSVATTQYVVAQLTVTSVNGFTDTMNVGCLGLPKAATCTFDKNSVALTSNGSFTVKVTVDTGSPLTAGGDSAELRPTQKPGSSSSSAASTVAMAGLPAGAIIGMLLMGRRRRKVTASLLILLLAVCLMPMFGCGTITQVSTPPGTYTFAVSAVGQHTGVTLSQNITLTVTK